MSSTKVVIVLTPNGRRQTVKASQNTTILQILEEVCEKHGLKAEQYDLKHHSTVLDTTTIIRFSGLPNNALLEMLEVEKIRKERDVTLRMDLEDGTRLLGTFSPSDNLLSVMKKLCPQESYPHLNPVIIYMRTEVYGEEPLQNTTLRALGLTGGRAMLRLVHRTPEELKTQANVSAPLLAKPNVEEYVKPRTKIQKTSNASDIAPSVIKNMRPTSDHAPDFNISPRPNLLNVSPNDSNFKKSSLSARGSGSIDKHSDEDAPSLNTKNIATSSKKKEDNKTSEPIVPDAEPEEEIIFLGDRNAVAYSLSNCNVMLAQYNDLPDDFFDLTVNDVKKLLYDLKKTRNDLDEAPLQTQALRNLEQSKKVLNQIRQYSKCVLRIQFPDRLVLQGTFGPKENIQSVIDFVKKYLANPDLPFYLFTTPPKHILRPSSILVEEGCVPSALLHFGVEGISTVQISNTPKHSRRSFIREDILTKLSTPTAAILAATKSRGLIYTKPDNSKEKRREGATDSTEPTSSGIEYGRPTTPSEPLSAPPPLSERKMPKWFKPSK